MNKYRVESIVAAAIFAAFGWSAVAADEALAQASGEQAKTEYWLMDHSPADPKAMQRMDKKPVAKTPQGKTEYSTMNHSPADPKAMQRMDKKPVAKTPQGKTEYSLMGHSPADPKAMRGMKGPEKVVTVDE